MPGRFPPRLVHRALANELDDITHGVTARDVLPDASVCVVLARLRMTLVYRHPADRIAQGSSSPQRASLDIVQHSPQVPAPVELARARNGPPTCTSHAINPIRDGFQRFSIIIGRLALASSLTLSNARLRDAPRPQGC
jgi:hypothetical protein